MVLPLVGPLQALDRTGALAEAWGGERSRRVRGSGRPATDCAFLAPGKLPRRGWLHLVAFVVALPAAVVLVLAGGPGDGVACTPWRWSALRCQRQLSLVAVDAGRPPAYAPHRPPDDLRVHRRGDDAVLPARRPRGTGGRGARACWAGAVAAAAAVAMHFEASRGSPRPPTSCSVGSRRSPCPTRSEHLRAGQLVLMAGWPCCTPAVPAFWRPSGRPGT